MVRAGCGRRAAVLDLGIERLLPGRVDLPPCEAPHLVLLAGARLAVACPGTNDLRLVDVPSRRVVATV